MLVVVVVVVGGSHYHVGCCGTGMGEKGTKGGKGEGGDNFCLAGDITGTTIQSCSLFALLSQES